jgi:hypothetical protein
VDLDASRGTHKLVSKFGERPKPSFLLIILGSGFSDGRGQSRRERRDRYSTKGVAYQSAQDTDLTRWETIGGRANKTYKTRAGWFKSPLFPWKQPLARCALRRLNHIFIADRHKSNNKPGGGEREGRTQGVTAHLAAWLDLVPACSCCSDTCHTP